MKLLIFSQHFWPESFRITEVARNLKATGEDVIVLTGQPNYPDGYIFKGYSAWAIDVEIYEGIEILRVPIIPRGKGGALRLILNYCSFVLSVSILGPWLLHNRSIDRILVYATSPIIQAIPAILLGKIKRVKVTTWVQDLWPESIHASGFVNNKFLLKLVAKFVEWIYRKSDLILVQSRAFIIPVSELAGATPVVFHPQPGELAYNEIILDRPRLILHPGFNVVFAGNLGAVQALPTIVEAACILRKSLDIKFVLIGSGSRLEWLKEEINRLKLDNIQLPGRFDAIDMPSILGQASVLLVSLVRSPIINHTIPGKVQSYLAARKPIIAAVDGEGARVIVESGAGISCPAEDPKALASTITFMYNMSSEELRSMGDAGRNYYDINFEPKLLASRLKNILSSLDS